tara:strand:+ start:48973 stop:49629 length:657 start_codon:yes stop_codon:yes gene_type:complete
VYKRVSDSQKILILESFKNGTKIKELSEIHKISIPTITRQIKKLIGEDEFKKIKNKYSLRVASKRNDEIDEILINKTKSNSFIDAKQSSLDEANYNFDNFIEISPLSDLVELNKQKELASEPILNFEFPKGVFLNVNNSFEIEPRLLSEYSEWSFLPKDDLDRKTLEIFSSLNEAKKSCKKNQKVIKVPNPKVFTIASKNLKLKGVTRIIFGEYLLSL